VWQAPICGIGCDLPQRSRKAGHEGAPHDGGLGRVDPTGEAENDQARDVAGMSFGLPRDANVADVADLPRDADLLRDADFAGQMLKTADLTNGGSVVGSSCPVTG
jgi:hypothetical protein